MSAPTAVCQERDADAIAVDVDRGLAIVAQLTALKKELDAIEDRLTADALARPDEHEPLNDEDREGKQFIAIGSKLRLPIVLTADKLVKSFTEGSKVDTRISAAAGEHFSSFFSSKRTWEARYDDGKLFRAKAAEVLGDKAPAFIAACRALDKHGVPKSDIKIEWQRAAAHAHLEGSASALPAHESEVAA